MNILNIFYISRKVALLLCCFLFTLSLCYAQLASLNTTTNGHGLFVYTLSPAGDELVFGGDSNLTFKLSSYAISAVSNPPGWESHIEGNLVTWFPTNEICLIDKPLDFTIVSYINDVTTYEELSGTGIYSQATILGNVYETNGLFYQPEMGSSNEVYSINMIGFERLTYFGPVVPEPVFFLTFLSLVLLRLRRLN